MLSAAAGEADGYEEGLPNTTTTATGMSHPVAVSSASSLDTYLLGLTSPNEDQMLAPLDLSEFDLAASALAEAVSATETPVAREVVSPVPAPSMAAQATQQPAPPADPPLLPGDTTSGNSVPEFLYQLTRMLTEDNKEMIEWTNSMIEVHNPRKLEIHVLHKYFRHSKFASFQRQLNYFGFRKLAGKGKMAPCSYVNQAAKGDIGSLLKIKRKTTPPRDKQHGGNKQSSKKQQRGQKQQARGCGAPIDTKKVRATQQARAPVANPVLVGILQRSQPASAESLATAAQSAGGDSHQALARTAVGRGIRYSYVAPTNAATTNKSQPVAVGTINDPLCSNQQQALNAKPEDSLSQLASNYQNSLNDYHQNERQALQMVTITNNAASPTAVDTDPTPLSQMRDTTSPYGCFLRRDSSLIDLAMLPTVEFTTGQQGDAPSFTTNDTTINTTDNPDKLTFVDFPHPEVFAKQAGGTGDSNTQTQV